MKIEINIDNIAGRYNVQIGTLGFTALEEEKLSDFGEPLIDVGGDFAASVTRPHQVNTVVTLTDGSGSGAVITPVLDALGAIVSYTVVSGGSLYVSPTVVITGDGTDAAATATLDAGVVTAVVPVTTGSGYHQTPVDVSFSLPVSSVRLRSDFPIKQVFDLADSLDADAQAKLFADTISDRIVTAKNALVGRTSPFEGQTITTI